MLYKYALQILQRFAPAGLSMLFVFSVSAQITPVSRIQGKADMAAIIQHYQTDVSDLERVYIFKSSPEYYQRFNQYFTDALKQLSTIKFEDLTTEEKADYLLLKREIKKDMGDLQQSAMLYDKVKFAVPFAERIVALQAKRRRGNPVDAMQFASTVDSINSQVNETKQSVKNAALLPAENVQKAVDIVEELKRGLQNTYSFYNAYDPLFTWWVQKPYRQADSSLSAYVTFLQTRTNKPQANDSSGIVGTPIGEVALKQLLQYEMISYSPEELVEIANREFAWCDAEMIKASREMGFGDDWKKALEKVKLNYVQPGSQPQLVNTLAEEAIQFLETKNLVTVPPLAKEVWRMNMLTEAQQRLAPFFLGGESILIGYPTNNMDNETKVMSMRSNNYGFSHATVFHELIPGHNLQYYMFKRYKPYRAMFRTPFSMEGWSLYWEMLLWDKGFNDTPEKKIGALFWRMHRCARIIFSLNYQLGKWTPTQCINFLVDRVGHERFSAEGEVRRTVMGNYGPLYQIAYMMGGLQLRALYKEVVSSGKMQEKDFHDRYLHEGCIPIEMLRAIITNQKLNENYRSNWRFAAE